MVKFQQGGKPVHKDFLKPVADDVQQPAATAAPAAGGGLMASIMQGKQLKKATVEYEVGQVVGTDIDGKTRSCVVTKVISYTDPVATIKGVKPAVPNIIARLIGTFLPKGDTYTLKILSNNEEIERQGHELKKANIDPIMVAMYNNP